jgi:ParB-like chromosome segregation protein Spo0J
MASHIDGTPVALEAVRSGRRQMAAAAERDSQVSQPQTMPIDSIHIHPLQAKVFGAPSDKQLDRLRESILARGILEPIVITPPDAIDYPLSAVNGNDRLRIARELGFVEVPVLANDLLRTVADQIDAMFHYAQRKDFTWSQRAKHAEAVRTMLAALPPDKRQERGYRGKDTTDVVAMIVRQPRRNVSRMQAVFQNPTSTDDLKSAVDEGKLSLYEADLIIQEVERRRAAGSRNARRLVNELLQRALRERRQRKNTKHTRAPRTPVFEAKPKRSTLFRDVQQQLLDWAMSETPAAVRNAQIHAPVLNAAVKDFMVEVRAAASAFRLRVRRISGAAGTTTKTPLESLRAVNDGLQILGLRAVKRLDDVDLDEVRRTHRVMARAYHPDLNDAPEARDKFERVHGAYERILEVCDGR